MMVNLKDNLKDNGAPDLPSGNAPERRKVVSRGATPFQIQKERR